MYSDCLVMNRLMQTIAWVMYTWTSTFCQAGLRLFTILLPYWPCQIHRHPCHSGSSTGCADAEDGWRGSNVYEVNTWLWQFGRGKPRLGGLTIEETSDRQDSASKASGKRRKETHLEPCAVWYHIWYHIIMYYHDIIHDIIVFKALWYHSSMIS